MQCFRAKSIADFQYIASLFKPENTRFMFTKSVSAQKLAKDAKREHYLIQFNERNIGWFNLRKDAQGKMWCGIIIDAPYQNKGYGTQALELICEEAKQKGADSLYARIQCGNLNSLNMFLHQGFKALRIDEVNCVITQITFKEGVE